MKRHTFLVEIGTEELPPKSLRSLAEEFTTSIKNEYKIAHINYGEINWYATPRRIAVKISKINSMQSDILIEKIGPPIKEAFDAKGNITKISKRWAEKCGININQSQRLSTDKGEWLIHKTLIKGVPVQHLLCDIITRALKNLPIKKMMRWGDCNVNFIRPIHTIVLMLDYKLIKGNVFGVSTNRILLGHRFMGKQIIYLEHANHYPKILMKKGLVIADYLYRKEKIRKEVELAAIKLNGIADIDNNLLEEITSLVEWPVILTASFKEKFLIIPHEVLVYIMKKKQRYFPIYNSNGKLLPYFIFVANIKSKDEKKIINGNEKVMQARLSDAEFFFNIDRKQKLENRLTSLDMIIFHKKLGSMLDKSKRIKTIATWIAHQINANVTQSSRAGLLSKCDLMTKMVFEFTDMQGIIGMYYARYDGETEEVALAQKEQYQPRFATDNLPTTMVSCTIAIADKIDTIVGILGISTFPKGKTDPFALRRSALGIIRIIIEQQLPLNIQLLIEKTVNLYNKKISNKNLIKDVTNFIFNRLQAKYQSQGYDIDTIKSVLAIKSTFLVDIDARIRAISYFQTLKESAALISANKRISNILAKNNDLVKLNLQSIEFKDIAEINLLNNLIILNKKIPILLEKCKYQDALLELAALYKPIDFFFKNVIVMTDNYQVRINRLTLIAHLHKLFLQIADISLLKPFNKAN